MLSSHIVNHTSNFLVPENMKHLNKKLVGNSYNYISHWSYWDSLNANYVIQLMLHLLTSWHTQPLALLKFPDPYWHTETNLWLPKV